MTGTAGDVGRDGGARRTPEDGVHTLVLTGGDERPDDSAGVADQVTDVREESPPLDAGYRGRQGAEY